MNMSAVLDPEVRTLNEVLDELAVCCSHLGLTMKSRIDLSRLRIEIIEVGSLAENSPVLFACERGAEWMKVTLLDALRAI